MDTRSKSDLRRPNSNGQNCAQLPVINTAFVLKSGTSLEPFLNQVISRMIKSTADPSGSQSASTPATSKFASDIYGTVVTKHIRHCSGHLHRNNKHKVYHYLIHPSNIMITLIVTIQFISVHSTIKNINNNTQL